MNRMISTFLGKLEEKRDQRKLFKYKNWCALVDKKCVSTLYSLKTLESTDTEKKDKLTLAANKFITCVNELVGLLSITLFKNDTSIMSSSTALRDDIRTTLLNVWTPLLTSIGKLEFIDVTAVTAVHKAVLLLMSRDEFSCDSFSSSKDSASKDILAKYRNVLQSTLQVATQRLVDKPSGASMPINSSANIPAFNPLTNMMMNINFACKVLAVLYWRLPYVAVAISHVLTIPDITLLAPVLSFPAFADDFSSPLTKPISTQDSVDNHSHPDTNSSPNNTTPHSSVTPGTHTTNNIPTTNSSNNTNANTQNFPQTNVTPNATTNNPANESNPTTNYTDEVIIKERRASDLFGWAALYKELPPMHDFLSNLLATPPTASTPSPTTPSSPPSSPFSSSAPVFTSPHAQTPTWISVLARFDVTYYTFFKEWILHVKSILGNVEWQTVPGFPRVLQSLLYQMRIKEQPPPPLTKPYPLLELQYLLLVQTKAELIDAFVKAAFLRTNVFDLLSVLNTLHLVEGWFSELQAHDFTLPVTFDTPFFCSGLDILLNSDHHQTVLRVITLIYTFSEIFHDSHRVVLFDLFLSKFFYILFMHWDPGVRNAYHQLLIFKMVRIKRSTLYHDGYVVKEMSQVKVTSYQQDETANGETRPSPLAGSRNGSGFFSTFSNVLPAFFSLSTSPDRDSVDKDGSHPDSTDTYQTNVLTSKDPHHSVAESTIDTTNTPNTPPASATPVGVSDTHQQNGVVIGDKKVHNIDSNDNEGFYEIPHPDARPPVSQTNNGQSTETLNGDVSSSIDVILFLKLNSYLKTIEDQLRKPTAKKCFEARLESYAPFALAEFNQHLARYHQWELKNEAPPRIMSLPFARMGEG